MNGRLLVTLGLVFVLTLGAAYAQPEDGQTAKPAPPQRTELLKINYLDFSMAHNLIQAYLGPAGRIIAAGKGEKTFVVTDTPENVAKILVLIRDLDVKPAEIRFNVQLIQGGSASDKGDPALLNDPVIKELLGILKYRSFTLLDGSVLQVIDGQFAETRIGPVGEYSLQITPRYIKDGMTETIETQIQFRATRGTVPGETPVTVNLVRTIVNLKAGEKTVVGVSKAEADKGLILILSGKPVR